MDAKKQLENLKQRHAEFRAEIDRTKQDLKLSESQRAEGLRAAALGTGEYSAKQNADDTHTIDMLRSQVEHLEEQIRIVASEIPKAKRAAAEQGFNEVVEKAVAKAGEEDAAWRDLVEKWNVAQEAWDKHSQLCGEHHVLLNEAREPYALWHDKQRWTPAEVDAREPGITKEKNQAIRHQRSLEYGAINIRNAVLGANRMARLLVPDKEPAISMNRVAGKNSDGGFRFDSLEQPAERE